MTHKRNVENKKFRQWVKAALAYGYLHEGLAPFCGDIAQLQHNDIINTIKQTKKLSAVTCGNCKWQTLKPDHTCVRINKQLECPLRQKQCNCCHPNKTVCLNNVCGAIYDEIIKQHRSSPPKPFWMNTQTQKWCYDPWSIAKCFINNYGYVEKTTAADTDSSGLLHVIINNMYFHKYIKCKIDGSSDVFSKVRQNRNEIFHSATMELDETVANTYIDDMIAVLQDDGALKNRQDAQAVVQKLQELKNKDFIITQDNQDQVLKDVREIENMRLATEGQATQHDLNELEKKLSALVSQQNEEITRLRTCYTVQEHVYCEKSKSDFQKQLIDLYRKTVLRVSAIPLQPEKNQYSFNDVYVRPRMTREIKDENGRLQADEIQSMSDIFSKAGNALRSIYVLGDTGSGKSAFCASLVNDWCMAHSEEQAIADEFDGIKEMKNFDFLFYISLRRCKHHTTIHEMVEKQYRNKLLDTILDRESAKTLIVLDGLDEWSPETVTSNQSQTEGLPECEPTKNYTILTTSRPWKIEKLKITEKEIQERVTLNGFDEKSAKTVIIKTVSILNKSFDKNKSSEECAKKLRAESVASIKRVPIMLLHLICLWFDDKLDKTSRCAIYSGMLGLLLTWNYKKETVHPLIKSSIDVQTVQLPQYLIDNKISNSSTNLVYCISRLAYETLFISIKETFDNSIFEQLGISDEVKSKCLMLGILSEDKCPILSASTSQSSLLCFLHKSLQEYLAAVYIAMTFKCLIGPSVDLENEDLSDKCKQCVNQLFSASLNLDDMLEQENVFSMLCGLEPRIATFISKYIYDAVSRDERVLEYRKTIDNEYRYKHLIENTQQCIFNCINEVQGCQTQRQCNFFLGDIVIESKSLCGDFCASVDKQYISHDNVMSFGIDTYTMETYTVECLDRVAKFLPKFRSLEAIHLNFGGKALIDDKDVWSVCETIEVNVSSLKGLSIILHFNDKLNPIYDTTLLYLSDMNQLVALKICLLTVTHTTFTSLCSFISGASHLKQICININCKCDDQHQVDLSKHDKLQCLEYSEPVSVACAELSNLEIFINRSSQRRSCTKVFDVLTAGNKLTRLELWFDFSSIHNVKSDKNPSYHTTVTDRLIALLPKLHMLHELQLEAFTLTDNIVQCPSKMKRMESIRLSAVKMSLTTWRKFIDSLPKIPQSIVVEAYCIRITRDKKECIKGIKLSTDGGVGKKEEQAEGGEKEKRRRKRRGRKGSKRRRKRRRRRRRRRRKRRKRRRRRRENEKKKQMLEGELEEVKIEERDAETKEWKLEEPKAAIEYVREQKALFHVEYVELEDEISIEFSTKK